MKLLAFDTSSRCLSVALLEEEQVLAETQFYIQKNHSTTLMPTIDFLVKSLGWTPQDLERIVVAKGPGSYTGLRIAVATGKVLASSLSIDLIGISSLLSLVPDKESGLVIPLIDARRNHVYAGFYEGDQLVQEEAYLPFDEVTKKVATVESVTFVGEVAPFREQIRATLPQASIKETFSSAKKLARLAREASPCSIHDFVPNYLKRVEAEERWLNTHQEIREPYITIL